MDNEATKRLARALQSLAENQAELDLYDYEQQANYLIGYISTSGYRIRKVEDNEEQT